MTQPCTVHPVLAAAFLVQDTVRMDMRMFAEYMSPDVREEWLASDSSSEDASPAPSSAAAASQLDSSASDDGVEMEEEQEVEEAVVDSDSDYEQPGGSERKTICCCSPFAAQRGAPDPGLDLNVPHL